MDKPAFPLTVHHESGDVYATDGLTRRELFAAMAMQGLCEYQFGYHRATPEAHGETIAKWSVVVADALIAALDAEPPK